MSDPLAGSQGELFVIQPERIIPPAAASRSARIEPLESWLGSSTARDVLELEPWQRWQLAWFGRCRLPRFAA